MSKTTGGKPTPVRGLANPKPSKSVTVTKHPNAKNIPGGTGSSRYLPRTDKPAR